MTFAPKLEKFEGPLDLLLQLIESADLDICEISLSQVADQFMKYLEKVEQKSPEELADFLVVAAKLLLIKSRVLLPQLHLEEESDALELEKQLKIYKEYFEAAKKIAEIIGRKKFMFAREKIPLDREVVFSPPPHLGMEKLRRIFLEIIKEIEPIVKLPKKSLLRTISIKEKIENIRQKIIAGLKLNFKDLIAGAKDRTEIIVTFLGLLELVKQRAVSVKQEGEFGEIILEKTQLDATDKVSR